MITRYLLPRLVGLLKSPSPVPHPVEEDHRVCMRVISELIALLREGGAIPVILPTPEREELDQPKCSERWRKDLTEFARRERVRLVDMLDIFRREPDRGHGAFRDDVHPNERGNCLMARAVGREILPLLHRGVGVPR